MWNIPSLVRLKFSLIKYIKVVSEITDNVKNTVALLSDWEKRAVRGSYLP